MKKGHLRKIIVCAVCIAFCVVLPFAFHSIPNSGQLLSPMHIPVFLAALAVGPIYGAATGVLGVALSTVLTQMPPAAMLPSMMAELFVYGLSVGAIFKLLRIKNQYIKIYVSLISGMLLGRIVAGVLNALVFSKGEYSVLLWISTYFVTALPGMIAHLIIVPIVYFALKKAKLTF